MKAVVMYRSNDGHLCSTQGEALAYDEESSVACNIEALLKPAPLNLRGWIQQDPASVQLAKERVVKAVVAEFHWETWYGFDTRPPEALVHPGSMASRVVSEKTGALSALWHRLSRIDSQGREWEQAYFAFNQERIEKGLVEYPEPMAI